MTKDFKTMTIKEAQDACHQASVDGGWWLEEPTHETIATKIALIHSEVSEALEGYRRNEMDDHLPHRDSLEVELTDAVIRIFDLAEKMGYDIAATMDDKVSYNAVREDHKLENRATTNGKRF